MEIELPQSLLTKITTSDSPLAIWTWASFHFEKTPDKLIASGYKRVSLEDATYTSLASQGCDVFLLDPHDGNALEIWALPEDVERVKNHPVILAFPSGAWPKEAQTIRMLQSLPPPQIGEFGGVISQGSFHIYPLSNLPSEAQQLQFRLHQALQTLASPGDWYPWEPYVTIYVSDRQAEAIDAYASLLTQNGSAHDKEKYVREQLKEVHMQTHLQRAARAKPGWLMQWKEIQHMMRDLASAYWTHHLNQQKSPPEIANVFQDGISEVITGLPFQAYPYAAIAPKDAWEEVLSTQEYEVILAHHYTKRGGTTSVQLRGDATGKTREMVLAALREQVNRLSDLHSDFFWAMVAQLLKGQRDVGGNAWITAQQLLDYRGISKIIKKENGRPRTAGHRQEDMFDASQIISSMENTWIKADNLEIIDSESETSKNKKRGRSRIIRESRLFMFGDIIYHQELSMDGTPGRRYPIAWQYRESNWMLPFLEGPNRFTGVLLEKTLHYDPHNQFWEKRLAKYFMVYFRTNASKYNRPIKIQELFAECNLPTNERYPQRTQARFEKAMNKLQEDGHLLNWAYQEQGQPPARNWLTTWLNYHIIVEPPQQLRDQYLPIKIHAQALRSQNRTQHKSRNQKQGRKAKREKP